MVKIISRMMDMNIQYLQGVGPRRAALLKSELTHEGARYKPLYIARLNA
jgi:hypothetical protein